MMAHSQNGNLSQSKTALIDESGLYSLILSSKLPQAKAFKHWVTKEVLPSIRKTGGYLNGQEQMSSEEFLSKAILFANRVIEEKKRKIAELEPKAEYFDRIVEKHHLMNFRDTAKALEVPQNTFVRFLMDKGLIYRDRPNHLRPYAESNNGYFAVKEYIRPDNSLIGIQTLITPKGRQYILLLLQKQEVDDA
ncbi:MAG: phage antirepressor KilAC domain-containing protein [Dialister sp.]|nr:phage antirepressor KilAC domain-containing protein [Dialister sp.]